MKEETETNKHTSKRCPRISVIKQYYIISIEQLVNEQTTKTVSQLSQFDSANNS
jgi:hypothetical protein